MLNILRNKGNGSQNNTEISPHSTEWLALVTQTTNAGEDSGKRNTSTLLVGM
jgi:hypothetical protein